MAFASQTQDYRRCNLPASQVSKPTDGLFQITLKKGPNLFSLEGIRNRVRRAGCRDLTIYATTYSLKSSANESMLIVSIISNFSKQNEAQK